MCILNHCPQCEEKKAKRDEVVSKIRKATLYLDDELPHTEFLSVKSEILSLIDEIV